MNEDIDYMAYMVLRDKCRLNGRCHTPKSAAIEFCCPMCGDVRVQLNVCDKETCPELGKKK